MANKPDEIRRAWLPRTVSKITENEQVVQLKSGRRYFRNASGQLERMEPKPKLNKKQRRALNRRRRQAALEALAEAEKRTDGNSD